MIPRPFAYERPGTVEEAVALLADAGEAEARVLAGGQSLLPMMSLGLARPDLIVDIGGLELAGLEVADGRLRVGALTTHRSLELGREAREVFPLAAEAARHIGNPRVRNRGTIGGSLAHAHPAAELAGVLLAQGGAVVARGSNGERRIPVEEFFLGIFATTLAADELVVAVEAERPPAGSGVAFEEFANRADDFATAAAAAVVTLDADGRTSRDVRVALVGVAGRPVRAAAAEEAARGEALGEPVLAAVQAGAETAVELEGDPFASGDFRRRVAGVCARRAVERAWSAAA